MKDKKFQIFEMLRKWKKTDITSFFNVAIEDLDRKEKEKKLVEEKVEEKEQKGQWPLTKWSIILLLVHM